MAILIEPLRGSNNFIIRNSLFDIRYFDLKDVAWRLYKYTVFRVKPGMTFAEIKIVEG